MNTATAAKPLVFISASHKDKAWRGRLKTKLDAFADQIEWWDDSKLQTSTEWPKQIEDAIKSARIAIILLSPDYVASSSARSELQRLKRGQRAGSLRLFPILLHDCDWREIEEIRDIQIWSMARPVARLKEDVVDYELEKIATAILTLASGEPDNPDTQPEFHFSEAADVVLRKARELAERSHRTGVTSSCLLFAFAETAGDRGDTSRFLRDTLDRTGGYQEAFASFLVDSGNATKQSDSAGSDLLGRTSTNARKLLEQAAEIASRVSGSSRISLRHLFAALLVAQEGDTSMVARERLAKLGIDLSRLCRDFREFVRANREKENADEWDAILIPNGGPPSSSDELLLSGKMTVGQLLSDTELGKAMDEVDQAAFRVGAAMAQELSSPLNSMGVLAGYLLVAKPGRGKSEEALAKAVWEAYLARHPERETTGTVEIWRVVSPRNLDDLVKTASENPTRVSDWKLSAGLGELLLRSVQVAVEAGRPQPFSTRHLVACLLGPREWPLDPEGAAEIEKLDLDLSAVRRSFRDWMMEWRKEDRADMIDSLLGLTDRGRSSGGKVERDLRDMDRLQGSDHLSGPAGYTSEFCGVGGNRPVADHLGVEALAHRLAELIALRETKLPLAIGLFGNWGSGKSHFMNLIDRKLKKLAAETPEDWARRLAKPAVPVRLDPTEEGPWCREIVPIYFNAWHYLDTNLWASLVTEIFDGLSAHLAPKQDELALMRSRLREAGGATARAEEEVTNAHDAVRKASVVLQQARAQSEGARQAVRGLMDNLRTLLPQVNTPENQQRIVEWLGVSAEVATLSQLAAKHREMVSVPGKVRELWRRATAREGMAGRIGWLFGALIVVPGLAWLGAALVPQIEAWLKSIGPSIKIALTALTGVAGWMTPAFAQVRRRLREMESWQKQAEEAQAAMPKDKQVIDAQEKVVQTEAAAAAAETGLAVARTLEQQLTKAVDDLQPERRLGRFIEARARSADYRGQLGLVSLARRDFQELSDIFADAEALQKKVDGLPASEGEKLKKLGASIDRIVLFVDDLDRCQPEKVADVLQAVHLLLAYPLFAVVVGVDQRCLKQSIVKQFRGLMSQGGGPKNGERSATPLDYLEKIFHVPFHLPPMEEKGFATLIHKLTEPLVAPPIRISPSDKSKSTSSPESREASPGVDQKRPATGGATVHLSTSTPVTPAPIRDETSFAGEKPKVSPTAAQVIGSVPLQAWERDALKDYHPLLCTPRGATRLLNTYRLVRAGIPADEWISFRGDGVTHGEFRVAMLLLASAAGYPAVAREWFNTLRNANSTALFISDDSDKSAPGPWLQFKTVYDATFAQATPKPTRELFVKWLERVERFAF